MRQVQTDRIRTDAPEPRLSTRTTQLTHVGYLRAALNAADRYLGTGKMYNGFYPQFEQKVQPRPIAL